MTDLSAPRIVIVGGVAGGASAAARARRVNEQARILVFERDAYISFANCRLPYYFGGASIDKRLDVVATLMHFCGTVHDLAALDLAYAPPFGAAKDPVHMAVFVAQNDLEGLLRLVQPGDDLSGFQIVDVREPAEIAARPLAQAPHATSIPLSALRGRLAELDPARLIALACRTGARSYVGTRILAQNGFADVRTLSGGAAMRDLALNRGLCDDEAALSEPGSLDDMAGDH